MRRESKLWTFGDYYIRWLGDGTQLDKNDKAYYAEGL